MSKKEKRDKTRYLQPGNFEQIMRLAGGLSRDETIAAMKAFQVGLGEERLYTATEVTAIVEQALARREQREPFLRGVREFAERGLR